MRRAVRSLISLVASSLVLFGVIEIGYQYMNHRIRNAGVSPWHCLAGGVLLVLGLILFSVGGRLAKRLTEDFDE
jgi:hypothetical protein